ncbi:MAG: phosphatase PAP2 family protein [Acidimicrobiia bacterium]
MHRDLGPPGHHHAHMFQDHRWAVAGASAMYVGAAVLLLVMAASPSLLQSIDDWWYDLMVSIEASLLTGFAKVLDVVGGTIVMIPLRAAMAIYLATRRRWAALTTFLSAIAVSELAIGPLKALYDRARPPASLVDTSSAAFPSGHATAAAVTAIILVVVLISPGEHRRAWEVRAGLFAFFMALSRTYLRAHWLTDVVAGALLGAATALAVAAVVQIVRTRLINRDAARVAPDG